MDDENNIERHWNVVYRSDFRTYVGEIINFNQTVLKETGFQIPTFYWSENIYHFMVDIFRYQSFLGVINPPYDLVGIQFLIILVLFYFDHTFNSKLNK